MRPATTTRIGGTTSPSNASLVSAGRLIIDNCGIAMSTNRITRLVLQFRRMSPQGNGTLFIQFLAAEAQLSEQQKRAALVNPDVVKMIMYRDPTGEQAVENVMRQQRRGSRV